MGSPRGRVLATSPRTAPASASVPAMSRVPRGMRARLAGLSAAGSFCTGAVGVGATAVGMTAVGVTAVGVTAEGAASARVFSMTLRSLCVSELKRAGLSSRPWRRASDIRLGGSSSSRGMLAPSTRMGMTRTFRCRAASISMRTKSLGSSSRRLPRSSARVSHLSPMSARRTSEEPTASPITSTKSSPSSIESTSLKMCSPPNRSASLSNSQPAGYAASSRR